MDLDAGVSWRPMSGVRQWIQMKTFMFRLGATAPAEGRAYLSGAGSLYVFGLPSSSRVVGLSFVPDQAGLREEAAAIAAEAGLLVSFRAPDQDFPVARGWEDRSPLIDREERLSFHHFDPVAQALARLGRDGEDGFAVAREMIAAGEIAAVDLRVGLTLIEADLVRYPAIAAAELGRRVEELCADPIAAALAKEERALLTELGLSGTDIAPRDALQKGLRVFGALQESLERKVCESARVRSLVDDGRRDLEVAAAVADLVAAVSHHVPAATVAALVVKSGVANLCQARWE